MKINEIYTSSSNFLKPADLKGTKPVLTIESTSLYQGKDQTSGDPYSQICLHFVGKEKMLGLNKTNANMIADLTGKDDSDDWIGLSIKLYVTHVQVGDKIQDGIRIFPELPEQVPFTPSEPKAEFTGKVVQYEDETPDDLPF